MTARKTDEGLNGIFRRTISWLPDGSVIYLRTLRNRGSAPEASPVPAGPSIQESDGVQGESRTFQDLLGSVDDEKIFEFYATSEMVRCDGQTSASLGRKGMITDVSPSPDGKWLLVTLTERPFSYVVPYYYFPSRTEIWNIDGTPVRTLLAEPLQENLPRGYDVVNPGPRNHNWRSDRPASLMWVEALDEGNYHAKEMQFHDQVYMLDAPFAGDPVPFIATEKRFQGIMWGNDNLAILMEGLSKSRVRVAPGHSIPRTRRHLLKNYGSSTLTTGTAIRDFLPQSPMRRGRSVLLLLTRAGVCFFQDPEPLRRATDRLWTNMT